MLALRRKESTTSDGVRTVRHLPLVPRAVILLSVFFGLAGLLFGLQTPAYSQEAPAAAERDQGPITMGPETLTTLRIHGFPVVGQPSLPPFSNRPGSPGSNDSTDPNSGLIPEAAPYRTMSGPFDPFADESTEMDLVTWDPAWISERLEDATLRADWPSLTGVDEVSDASAIRASGINASETVWLRHWYEPFHLDIDLNADGRLTDADNDGAPDAPANPLPSELDEWFPAIMPELTFMLLENDPLPMRDPRADELHRSAPRPSCGAPGRTRIVFPVGSDLDSFNADGPLDGSGLTSLDIDLDGSIDMVNVSDEAGLARRLGGPRLDFDGDGSLDALDADGTPLSCDEMTVLHSDSKTLRTGESIQFLDHYLRLVDVSSNGAQVEVWYNGDLAPRLVQRRSLGDGSALIAGDTGPLLVIDGGGDNLGQMPPGAWFAYLDASDDGRDTANFLVGRALGAPCASMQSAANVANLEPGGPWFLKRMYVDGHAYDVTAIGTCPNGDFQFLTLRAPIPKVDVTLEQHSVRLKGYAIEDPDNPPWLPLPPPFNHEHTILEAIDTLESFEPIEILPDDSGGERPRPQLHYMGGPIGPISPVLPGPDSLPYRGRDPQRSVGPYTEAGPARWTYIEETIDPAMSGILREQYAPEGGNRRQIVRPTVVPPTPRPTLTPSSTPTPSQTPSPTQTLTPSITPSPTTTPTHTTTPSSTPTPSNTPTLTSTPTNTPTATNTAIPVSDFGDAPAALGYPTLLQDNGARHVVNLAGPVLGACVDIDNDGQPELAAAGDDRNGPCSDDEDGIQLLSDLVPDLVAAMQISTLASPAQGIANAWIDFNKDGDWDDVGEKVVSDRPVPGGRVTIVHVVVPADALPGPTYLRIRFSSQGGLGVTGPAPDGEIEDHLVQVNPDACVSPPLDNFDLSNDPRLSDAIMVHPGDPGPLTIIDDGGAGVFGRYRQLDLGPFVGGDSPPPLNQVVVRINDHRLEHAANPNSQADVRLSYDRNGNGLMLDLSNYQFIRLFMVFSDNGVSNITPIQVEIEDESGRIATLVRLFGPSTLPFALDFPIDEFDGIGALDRTSVERVTMFIRTNAAEDFVLDEITPCVPTGDPIPLALSNYRWPEDLTVADPGPFQSSGDAGGESLTAADALSQDDVSNLPPLFYNEQFQSLPHHYTEFVQPDQPIALDATGLEADHYHVASTFLAPTAGWRRWAMPEDPVPAFVPPLPPDLRENITPDGGFPVGMQRRAAFWFDPDDPAGEDVKLWIDGQGARLYGGQPRGNIEDCDPARSARLFSAGDTDIATDAASGSAYPIEVFPYTDPFAPFSPQHPHAPRSDSITVNPAYMDAFRHHGEDLASLYAQIDLGDAAGREKVYHRIWFEPEFTHTEKLRFIEDCRLDFSFPALMQEYTYLYMDKTDAPASGRVGEASFAFPLASRADELPLPLPDGTLPNTPHVAAGLTTFDADFDDKADAVKVHSEASLQLALDKAWQSIRDQLGPPPPTSDGPSLDFDGDGAIDPLDANGLPLDGDELVVFALEDLVLDIDPTTPNGSQLMFLDHGLQLQGVTRGERVRLQFWFSGGSPGGAYPDPLGGPVSLEIGDAAIVDHFQGQVTVVHPGEQNPGVDGAWFVYVNDVATQEDQVTLTVGRALGATHSAIDDAEGGHDLVAGDPWYLKRFYADGRQYDIVALMTQPDSGPDESRFQFITLRSPLPIRDAFDPQDSLLLPGLLESAAGRETPVLPPFNVDHTIALDIDPLASTAFANTREYGPCTGQLAAFGPLAQTIVQTGREARYGSRVRQLPPNSSPNRNTDGWEVDHGITVPRDFLEVALSAGQHYLYTSNWRSAYSRLHYHGCLPDRGQGEPGIPDVDHATLSDLAASWGLPPEFLPAPNQFDPPQPDLRVPAGEPPYYAPFFDAFFSTDMTVRVKRVFDPGEPPEDLYVNRWAPGSRDVPDPGPGPAPTATALPAFPPPGAPDLNLSCASDADDPMRLVATWVDRHDDETIFDITASVNGSPPIEIGLPVRSTTREQTGASYSFTTPQLPAGLNVRFRVRVRDEILGRVGEYSLPSPICQVPEASLGITACVDGQLDLQGGMDPDTAYVLYDGFPGAAPNDAGQFEICGGEPGSHALEAQAEQHLGLLAQPDLEAGQRTALPPAYLYGGDANDDERIDLFDLVRVGANYGLEPPEDPTADVNHDGRVDLFDLVLVASNYGLEGPLPWGFEIPDNWREAVAIAGLSGRDARLEVETARPSAAAARDSGAAGIRDDERSVSNAEDKLRIEIVADHADALFGADLTLRYDPDRWAVVDADPGKPGLQIESGTAWPANGSFVALNAAGEQNGEAALRFAASLQGPTAELQIAPDGSVVLAIASLVSLSASSVDPTLPDDIELEAVALLDGAGDVLELPSGLRLRLSSEDPEPSVVTRLRFPWLGRGGAHP